MATLKVRVTTRARTEDARVDATGALVVRVRVPALEGRANAAALEVIARALGVPPSTVRLTQGARSRRKVVAVEGIGSDELGLRLQRLPRA